MAIYADLMVVHGDRCKLLCKAFRDVSDTGRHMAFHKFASCIPQDLVPHNRLSNSTSTRFTFGSEVPSLCRRGCGRCGMVKLSLRSFLL